MCGIRPAAVTEIIFSPPHATECVDFEVRGRETISSTTGTRGDTDTTVDRKRLLSGRGSSPCHQHLLAKEHRCSKLVISELDAPIPFEFTDEFLVLPGGKRDERLILARSKSDFCEIEEVFRGGVFAKPEQRTVAGRHQSTQSQLQISFRARK
jgi:hypothetical protein